MMFESEQENKSPVQSTSPVLSSISQSIGSNKKPKVPVGWPLRSTVLLATVDRTVDRVAPMSIIHTGQFRAVGQPLSGTRCRLPPRSFWILISALSSRWVKKTLPMCFYLLFISSLPTILHLGEDFLNLSWTLMNIWWNWHMISAKSIHDLDFERSKQNRHDLDKIDIRSRLGQRTKPVPIKWISSMYTIDFKRSYLIQTEFVVPSGNTLQTPISIIRFQTLAQLSKLNAPYMPSLYFTEEKQHHMSRPTNVFLTQQLKAKWPQVKPNMS